MCLPARWLDSHHHGLSHLCYRSHCGSHHADLLWRPTGRVACHFSVVVLQCCCFTQISMGYYRIMGDSTCFLASLHASLCHSECFLTASLPFCFVYCKVFNQGAVVTDVAQCTSLGFDVLEKQGSSVDAAITAALCLGIVHPHTSGIGGWVIGTDQSLLSRTTIKCEFEDHFLLFWWSVEALCWCTTSVRMRQGSLTSERQHHRQSTRRCCWQTFKIM